MSSLVATPLSRLSERPASRAELSRAWAEQSVPGRFVRWAFYLSVFAIPFARLYVPGTGERVGVTRLVQVLLFAAVLCQPRVCLRRLPAAVLWFAAYCLVRIAAGLWLAPEWSSDWWPTTLDWLQFLLPWLWIMFNVVQDPRASRGGLWAFIAGCSLCALLHCAGIGVLDISGNGEDRSTVFGENANLVAATYGTAMVALVGLGLLRGQKLWSRLALLPLLLLLGVALAKTGSRTGLVIVLLGMAVLMFPAAAFIAASQRYLALILAGAVLAGVLSQIPAVVKRFQAVGSNARQKEGRARMIPVLWEIFLRSPVYGSGPDAYQLELTRRAMPHLIKQHKTIASHNLALLLLAETGLIGFGLYWAGLAAGLRSAWRARRLPCGLLPLALLLPLAVAGLTISNPSSSRFFWLALAYALAGRS